MNFRQIARMIDISAVRTDATIQEINHIVEMVKRYQFICAFAMPCFTKYLVDALKDEKDVCVGGVVGFPSGADTTFIKIATTKDMMSLGVDEIDMVINVGALKDGNYDMVEKDIRAVVEAANGLPVKSILEVGYLSDYEIAKGAELAVKAGVTYVKTGTGWAQNLTTVDHIHLIKRTVGDAALIKAAGGIRTLDTVLEMIDAGCSRFGIGLKSAENIMDEASKRWR